MLGVTGKIIQLKKFLLDLVGHAGNNSEKKVHAHTTSKKSPKQGIVDVLLIFVNTNELQQLASWYLYV